MVLRLWTPDIAEIGDRIAGLSHGQAALLSRYLADTHRIMAARVTGIDREPQPDVVVEEGVVEPATFAVVLEGFVPHRKIAVIRAVRDLLGLGLRDAIGLVETAPSVIWENLSQTDAEILKAQLEAAGGMVALRRGDV